MSGFGLTLTYDDLGIRAVAGRLRALVGNLGHEILAPVGSAMEATTIDRFETGVGPDGQAWSPSLRASLAGGKTLVDKGHLRDSIHSAVDGDAVEIGSADIRSPVHQFGATITAKNGGGLSFTLANGAHVQVQSVRIPARPFVGLSAEDRVEVVDIARNALTFAIGGVA